MRGWRAVQRIRNVLGDPEWEEVELYRRKEGESNAQGTLLCSTAFQAAAVTYRLALPWLPARAMTQRVLCLWTTQVHRAGTDQAFKLCGRTKVLGLFSGGSSSSCAVSAAVRADGESDESGPGVCGTDRTYSLSGRHSCLRLEPVVV